MDLLTMIRGLRNEAAEAGDMETACRHERRLQILVGMPESFTAKHSGCLVCHAAPCVCPELFEDDGGDIDPEALDLSPFRVELPEGVDRA